MLEKLAVFFMLDMLVILAILLDTLLFLVGYAFLKLITFGKFKSDKKGVLIRIAGFLVVSPFGLFIYFA